MGMTPFLLMLLAVPSFGAYVRGESLREALPEVFKVLGPAKFFGVVDFLNELDGRGNAPNYCNGRLTLTSGTAFTTADVADATTIYFTPFGGDKITLYTGSKWQVFDFKEVSVSVPATTNTPFDIFGYLSGGNLALETLDWTNATTRATALTKQDGVYVKTGAATRRYLGTGYTEDDSGEMHDAESHRYLWNNCNRRSRRLRVNAVDNSYWGYQGTAWHAANADTEMRVRVVVGLPESLLELMVHHGSAAANASGIGEVAIGEDSTTSPHAQSLGRHIVSNTTNNLQGVSSLRVYPSVGYHYYQWIERSLDAVSSDFWGGTHTNCSGTGTTCLNTGMSGFVNG